MKSKILFYILVIPLIAIAGTLIYFGYFSFSEYQELQKREKHIELSKKLGDSIISLSQEKLKSALYFGDNKKNSIESLHQARNAVNRLLNEALNRSKENSILDKYLPGIQLIQKSLQEARGNIDSLSGKYHIIFNNLYHNEVYLSAMKIISDSQSSISNQKLKIYMKRYYAILENIENISNEESFLSYVVENKKHLDSEDMVVWESMVSRDLFSNNISTLPDTALSDKLKVFFSDEKDIEQIDLIRAHILDYSIEADYDLNPKTIVDAYSRLSKVLYKSSEMIYKKYLLI